jgi:hypothetical protein
MVTVLVIHNDAALRLAARRALESAGFAVSEAPDATFALPVAPQLVIAAAGIAGEPPPHYAAARFLLLGEEGLMVPFTPSQLLAAVRLTLARDATREPRRRSASRPRRQA